MDLPNILFRSGDLFLPNNLVGMLNTYLVGDDTTLFYVNIWTILHFSSGILIGFLLVFYKSASTYFWTGFLIHTAWEIWQIIVKNTPIQTLRGQIDILTDTFAFLIGMYLYVSIMS